MPDHVELKILRAIVGHLIQVSRLQPWEAEYQSIVDDGVPLAVIRDEIAPDRGTPGRKAVSRAMEALDCRQAIIRVGDYGRTTHVKLQPVGLQAVVGAIPEADLRRALRLLRKTTWWPKRWKPAAELAAPGAVQTQEASQ